MSKRWRVTGIVATAVVVDLAAVLLFTWVIPQRLLGIDGLNLWLIVFSILLGAVLGVGTALWVAQQVDKR